MNKEKPYCDVFEDEWFIAQKNGLNLSMNTRETAEEMLRLESENAQLDKILIEIQRILDEEPNETALYLIDKILNEAKNENTAAN